METESRSLRARLAQALRTALGAPDYDAYLEHMRRHHPEQTPLDAKAFFRERQRARYRRGGQRCC